MSKLSISAFLISYSPGKLCAMREVKKKRESSSPDCTWTRFIFLYIKKKIKNEEAPTGNGQVGERDSVHALR